MLRCTCYIVHAALYMLGWVSVTPRNMWPDYNGQQNSQVAINPEGNLVITALRFHVECPLTCPSNVHLEI